MRKQEFEGVALFSEVEICLDVSSARRASRLPSPGGTPGKRKKTIDLGPTARPFVTSYPTNDRTFGPLIFRQLSSQAFRLG